MFPKLRLPRTFHSVVVNKDAHDTRWANPDILPVAPEQQQYTWRAFFGYWFTIGMTTTVWALSSSHLANGLDAGAAIGGIFVGSVLSCLVAFFCSEPGIRYHLGFPMMSRATFGMYGSYFVIILKCFVNFIFFGIQSFWGGQAMAVILSAVFPSFAHMENTLPESAGITTQQLVGFVIYIVVFTSMMFIHPSKLQPVLFFSQIAIAATIVGLFIWAMSTNHGATILPPSKSISSSERSFRILQAISSVAGAWTGSAIRQSDWTRYTKSRNAVVWHQLITGPVTMTVCATFGVAATSAVKEMYGTAIWNPITLLQFLIKEDYSSTTRAGAFFAGVGFFTSQVSVNLVQNSVSCGMDLASLLPKYIDVTRGSLIMCLVGYLIQPWRFVEQPGTFIAVLNAFGMFVSPLAGVNCVDFWLIRKMNWKIPDLYRGDSGSIYWYTYGWNWRALAAWALTIWPCFPGFIATVSGKTNSLSVGWIRTFQVAWVVGFCGAAVVYYILCLISPPPGKPYVLEYLDTPATVIVGTRASVEDGKMGPAADVADVEKQDL
ncbi:Uracil permease [Pleurostoma richardsiae]|uniref:Uracil permease n=1 Tax=Pleurostoma richardsiae TaxID=41990 RepID=A0AA38RCI7_9PEZI|nr:Uracil permease [Pleurostoma richardsiae]